MPDTPLPSDYDESISDANILKDSYFDENLSSRRTSLYSDTQLPRIIVTPTPEDNANDDQQEFNQNNTIAMLTSKLKQLNDKKIELTSSEEYLADDNDNFMENQDEIELENKMLMRNYDDSRNAHSITNINAYEMDYDNETDTEHTHHDLQSNDSDDESADIIEFIIQNDSQSDIGTCEDYLSVIYEEDDEHSHSRRIKLDSICSSNSSATLANEQSNEKHLESEVESSTVESDEEEIEEYDDEEDHSSSVTVRLPLRLSFSRSSNNEEITTVMVGKSEIQIDEGKNKSVELAESPSDVSVSFSLRKHRVGEQTSLEISSFDKDEDNTDIDDESEVSLSVSLPLRNCSSSPKFLARQQTLSPVSHNIDEYEYKPWNFSFDNPDPEDEQEIECETKLPDITLSSKIDNNNQMYAEESNKFEYENNENEQTNNNYLDEKSKMSVRERIATFNSSSIRKEEFRRQNAYQSNDSTSDEMQLYEQFPIKSNEMQSNNRFDIKPAEMYCSTVHVIEKQNCNTTEHIVNEDESTDDKANLSIRDKIAAFEQSTPNQNKRNDTQNEISTTQMITHHLQQPNHYLKENFIEDKHKTVENRTTKSLEVQSDKIYEKNPFIQRSTQDESELDEDDSGVMDINRRTFEETDTESECFTELRKLTRYERAATHSRLFKLLQEYENECEDKEKTKIEEDLSFFNRPKKIIHNVSITRKQNPELIKHAETMIERRERLSLNHKSSSIDTDNPSSSASPSCASPALSVNEKLIDELVQSVLQQTKRRKLRNIPVEKIQAAARRALQQQLFDESIDSCDTFSSLDSTPALTPQEFKDDYYYCDSDSNQNLDILPSKAFKHLQEQSTYGRNRKLWSARCPRVLSSKTVNSDLSRVTETRESQTPEHEQQQYPY